MKLVHKKTGKEAFVGDVVCNSDGIAGTINFFREPHKPSSEGKISVNMPDQTCPEHYVGVWGLQWIEREDREHIPDAFQPVVPNLLRKKKPKPVRSHNEWFRSVSLGGRKSCPNCAEKLEPGESIWSWGEYLRAKWRTVMHFCKNCYVGNVRGPLKQHTSGCGCKVELVGYGGAKLPEWLTLE